MLPVRWRGQAKHSDHTRKREHRGFDSMGEIESRPFYYDNGEFSKAHRQS